MIANVSRQWDLKSIYFYLTEGCNLKCRHCWLSPQYQKYNERRGFLDYDLFAHIIKQAKEIDVRGAKLTGGEPLMHPDIEKIINHIREMELNLIIETNGVLCSEDIARQIAAVPNRFVSVSLDAVDAETHDWIRGVKGSFNDALRGIKNLTAQDIKPEIIMTVMKRNCHQLEDMLAMAKEIGAGHVKFNVIMPTGRGEKLQNNDEGLSVKDYITIGAWVENELSGKYDIKTFYHHPAAFRPLGKMFGDANGCSCCSIKSIIGVLFDGSYALCGIGSVIKELVFGDASKDSLADVWNSNETLNRIRTDLPGELTGVCADCLMKDFCLGSCVAQNYFRKKDLMAPFWYCEEANKLGLFPATRLKARH